MEELLLPCLNKEIFGIDCYGCGGQRALLLVFKGEFAAAFKMFPAIYPLLFLFAFVLINLFVKFKADHLVKITLILVTAGVILLNYLLKMFHLININ